MPYNSQLTSQVIDRLRTKRSMSQQVLSDLSGITRSHLTVIESRR